MKLPKGEISLSIPSKLPRLTTVLRVNSNVLVTCFLIGISIATFANYYLNGLGLSYNDARSHLDIGRRVVEGLKPGLAQLGSVWLPLPHLFMVPTIWNDFMWHSGLAGALQSMVSFVVTGMLIIYFLRKFKVSAIGQIIGLLVFVANLNVLYLQSTAMTELLLIAATTAGVYELVLWFEYGKIFNLIRASFLIMLATLIRYDGWFLLFMGAILIGAHALKKKGFKAAEGTSFFFLTLGAFGIFLWFLWNLLIFKDPLYFAFGPYSAHAQQQQLQDAGVLATKGNLFLSSKIYFYALAYNSGAYTMFLGLVGAILFYLDKKIKPGIKLGSLALFAPLFFNIIALYLGFSVLFVQGISGNTWFNVRYGMMMIPTIAIFVGFLVSKLSHLRYVVLGSLLLVLSVSFINGDAVTIDDARVGSSQKNVSEVSGWLTKNAKDKEGFILISAASHDAIIFSSGLPMKRFIHEGTGKYWESATTSPDRWARWIIMRTNDLNDQTFKLAKKSGSLYKYTLAGHYPFADIYELRPEYLTQLNTTPVFGKQK
jgi:hypothetical protein